MMTPEGTLLWQPPSTLRDNCRLQAYMQWLAEHKHVETHSYEELWNWSVNEIEAFWGSIWEYFDVQSSQPYQQVLAERRMPGAVWFEGARLNYAENTFRNRTDERPAIIFQSETQALTELSWNELEQQVRALAAALRSKGVQRGDRVVAYIPNIPQAVVGLLATASLGAIWSSCSPDMGSGSVIDRFKQIEPKVLLAVDGYVYGGKPFDRRDVVATLQNELPTLQHTILVPYLNADVDAQQFVNTERWDHVQAANADAPQLTFEQLPFDHPLWVLYSSGTTGLPKPIVQGHGGILLEHLKSVALHHNLGPGDRFFWFTTTGWMMWNFLVGGLQVGCTILLYDGSPAKPTMDALWSFAERSGMTYFGTSAAYISSCLKAGLAPNQRYDLSRLRGFGSTGSPLTVDGFQWVYDNVRSDIWLSPISGGTDVCTAFIGGCPMLPVHAGEMQCRELGCAIYAFDENGQPLDNEVGELVITQPMPSMPLFFWNDPDGKRYHESYFDFYPGIWRHGDWCKITPRGGVVISGRSDATINRMGIRMGTSELYRAVENIPEVLDSLVVDLEVLGYESYMPLFVVLAPGVTLDEALTTRIKRAIRDMLSPRHVPDEVFAVPDVPRTLSGKKMELPIKKILLGAPIERAANRDSMSNPSVLLDYVDIAQKIQRYKKQD